MRFVPVEGKRLVHDPETGVVVRVGNIGPEIETLNVRAMGLYGNALSFSTHWYAASDRPSYHGLPVDIEIYVGGIELMFRSNRMSDFGDNTRVLMVMLDGMFTFNRHWPYSRTGIIISDIEKADMLGMKFCFAMPSNADLIEMAKGGRIGELPTS